MNRHKSGPVRSERARRAILEATARQFSERGYEGITIQGVADEAEVGKQTIYRWWTGKAELLTDALLEGLLWDRSMVPNDTGDVDADVTDWLKRIFHSASTSEGAGLMRSLIAAASVSEEFGRRLNGTLNGEDALYNRLKVAQQQGQLAADAPIERIAEMLVGAVVLRVLTWQQTDDAIITELATYALRQER